MTAVMYPAESQLFREQFELGRIIADQNLDHGAARLLMVRGNARGFFDPAPVERTLLWCGKQLPKEGIQFRFSERYSLRHPGQLLPHIFRHPQDLKQTCALVIEQEPPALELTQRWLTSLKVG